MGGKDRSSRNDGNSNLNINDPAIVDQLVKALLGQQEGQNTTPHQAFNRMSRMSRSMRQGSTRTKNDNPRRSSWLIGQNQGEVFFDMSGCLMFAKALSCFLSKQ